MAAANKIACILTKCSSNLHLTRHGVFWGAVHALTAGDVRARRDATCAIVAWRAESVRWHEFWCSSGVASKHIEPKNWFQDLSSSFGR